MHPRSLLLAALLSHQASASWLFGCCRKEKEEKKPDTSVEDFLLGSGGEPNLSENKVVPARFTYANPAASRESPSRKSSEEKVAQATKPPVSLEPPTTTTAVLAHESAAEELPLDDGPAKAIAHEFADRTMMRPPVYQKVLDSLLESGNVSTLDLILNQDKMGKLAEEEYSQNPGRLLLGPMAFVRDVSKRLYRPVVKYLISDEFMGKARAAGCDDLIGALETRLAIPFLKKAARESNRARVAEILARHAGDLARCVNRRGYPLNTNFIQGIDKTFLNGCERVMWKCTNPAVLDEFFKYPYFAWEVSRMLFEWMRPRNADFAQYLASRISEDYYNLSKSSLRTQHDLGVGAHNYRHLLHSSFLNACSYGLPQVAAVLGKFKRMPVKGGFIEAILSGHSDVMEALVQSCGNNVIPSQEMLLVSLQRFNSHVFHRFYSTWFNYPEAPESFASVQDFVQFLSERISLIARKIASHEAGEEASDEEEWYFSDLGRRSSGSISEDKRMKAELEATLQAVQAYQSLSA